LKFNNDEWRLQAEAIPEHSANNFIREWGVMVRNEEFTGVEHLRCTP
jgi:hypothetical protein